METFKILHIRTSEYTRLAGLYLEAVLQLKSVTTDNYTEQTETQTKLHSLQKSDFYRIHFILDKIKGTDLHMEKAILYGETARI